MMGNPAGRNGVEETATAAPTVTAAQVAPSRRAGMASAASRAGKAASSPRLAGSATTPPSVAPSAAPTGHETRTPSPHNRKAARARRGSDSAVANAAVSSLMRWAPRTISGVPRRCFPTARPYPKLRVLTNKPASAARIGAPPAARMPTKTNSDDPARTTVAITTICQRARPAPCAATPYDVPMTRTDRDITTTARRVAVSSVLQAERMTIIVNKRSVFVKMDDRTV